MVLANENQGHDYYQAGFPRDPVLRLPNPDKPDAVEKQKKVMLMYETDHNTIKELFYRQMSELTRKTNSFDYQFSDRWTPSF